MRASTPLYAALVLLGCGSPPAPPSAPQQAASAVPTARPAPAASAPVVTFAVADEAPVVAPTPPGCAALPTDRSRVLAPQLGVGDGSYQLEYSPDGKVFATSGFDGSVLVWDGATAQLRLALAGTRGHTGKLHFDPASQWVAMAVGASVDAWQLDTGARKTLITADERVFDVGISPDGSLLVTNHDKHLRIWTIDGKPLATLPTGIEGAEFAPDSKSLVSFERSVFVDKTVTLWDPTTGKQLWTRTGKRGDGGGHAVWRPDGAEIAWIPDGPGIEVLDARTGAVKRTLRTATTLAGLGWAKDGKETRLVAWGRSGELLVFDAASGRTMASHRNVRFHGFVVSPDGRFVAIRRINEGITLLDVGRPNDLTDLAAPDDDVWQMGFHPTEKRLGVAPGLRRRIPSILDLVDHRATRGELPVLDVSELALSADGSKLITLQSQAGAWDLTLRVTDARTGAARGVLDAPAPKKDEYLGYSHVLYSPSGANLLASKMGRLDLFDGAGKFLRTAEAFPHFKTELPAAFSRDGRRLAIAGGEKNTVRVYDPKVGIVKESEVLVGGIVSLGFNPSRKLLAAGATGKLAILDPETGKSSGVVEGDFRRVESIAWRNDTTLFFGNQSGSVGRVEVGGKIELFAAHDARIRDIAMSPDGQWLATSAEDGRVKIWEAASMKLVQSFDVGNRAGTSVVWHPTAPVVFAARGSVFALRVDGASVVLDLARIDGGVAGLVHSSAGLFGGDEKAFAAVRFLPKDSRRTGDFAWYDTQPALRRPALIDDLVRGCPVSR